MARHDTFMAVMTYLATWFVVVFGVLGISATLEIKIILEVLAVVGFGAFGGTYFFRDYQKRHKQSRKQAVKSIPPPLRVETSGDKHLVSKRFFWFGIFMEFYQAGVAFLTTISTWRTFLINGVEIVTVHNLISLMFSVMGIIVIAYTINRIQNRRRYIESK